MPRDPPIILAQHAADTSYLSLLLATQKSHMHTFSRLQNDISSKQWSLIHSTLDAIERLKDPDDGVGQLG